MSNFCLAWWSWENVSQNKIRFYFCLRTLSEHLLGASSYPMPVQCSCFVIINKPMLGSNKEIMDKLSSTRIERFQDDKDYNKILMFWFTFIMVLFANFGRTSKDNIQSSLSICLIKITSLKVSQNVECWTGFGLTWQYSVPLPSSSQVFAVFA